MGLIKQSDWLRPRHALRRQHEGQVIDNADPRMLGRVKVNIPGLMEERFIPKEDLPWVSPQYPAELGNPVSSEMKVPVVGTTILVEFPTDSCYQPVYRWRLSTRPARSADYMSEYPDKYGPSDDQGNKTIITKAEGHASKEERIQDGTQTYHDSERSVTLSTDPHGTVMEIDRANQKLFARFGSLEITVTPDGVSINVPSLIINAEDALSLITGQGLDVESTKDGHGIASYLANIANTIAKNSGGAVE